MSRKYGTLSSSILTAVGEATGFFSWPLEGSLEWVRKQTQMKRKSYNDAIWRMRKNGLLKVVSENSQKFIRLTKKGQIEMLLAKMALPEKKMWDGHWRMLIFDIPEDCREKRDLLRSLLKRNDFIKLQASVFVSPYALNREAVEYLKISGLKKYIRIIKIDEIDSDEDLRKRFNLKKSKTS